jgi:glucosyl-dolichyl phosphate glucuronosyltransferase
MPPLLSLVLCTYNNADSLKITLGQLLEQKLCDPNQVEFIIINNNSSDQTQLVIENAGFGQLNYQYFIEARQGLSHARNLGVSKAKGDYILFTDDDADIPPDWIQKYINHLNQNPIDAAFGKIEIIWDKPKPWWYDERYRGFFAMIDHGSEAFAVTSSRRHPFYGKNFCVKKSIICDIGGFDPKLGRKGSSLLGSEEIALFIYLLKQKKSIWYYPDIIVGHRLKEREYTTENISNQHLACAKPIIWFSYKAAGAKIFGRNLSFLKDTSVHLLEYIIAYSKAWNHNDKKELFFLRLEIRRCIYILWYWVIKLKI